MGRAAPRRAARQAHRRARPGRPAVHLQRQRRVGRRPRRRRAVRDRRQVGPVQREGQLPGRVHGQRHHLDAYEARRHPPLADRPGPQHRTRCALHPVPGVRPGRRQAGRGHGQDRRRHRRRGGRRHRRRPRGLPQLRAATSSPGRRILTVFDGALQCRGRHRRLHAAARRRVRVGRRLRQPRRPVPRRRRLPRQASTHRSS